jgi:hypothetical protein
LKFKRLSADSLEGFGSMATTARTERHPAEAPAITDAPARSAERGVLRRALPTALIFATLVALAAWGHHTHWRVPTFAELTAQGEAEGVGWCEAHNVPSDQWIECQEGLLPRGLEFGGCKVHGVAE